MPSGRSAISMAAMAAISICAAQAAHADSATPAAAPPPAATACAPDDQACTLAQSGEAALAAQQYPQAVEQFTAALAAKPTSRAYFGLARALEAQKRLAAAYDAIVSAIEIEKMEGGAPPDDATRARADAIAAAVKRLRAQVAIVHLALPTGILMEEIATVRRKDDGVIADPFTRGVAVGVGQTLDITLRDGRHGTVTPDIALGGDGNTLVELDLPPEQFTVAAAPPEPKPFVRVGAELGYYTNRVIHSHEVADDEFVGFAWVELHPLRDPFGKFDVALTGRIGGGKHLTQDEGPAPPTLADVRLDQSDFALQTGPMIGYGPVFGLAEIGYLSTSQTLFEEPFGAAGTSLSTSVSSTTGNISVGVRYSIFKLRLGVQWGSNGLETRWFAVFGFRGFPIDPATL